MIRRQAIVLALPLVLLAGCATDGYTDARATCLDAYEKAPNWTSDLGGPEGACDTWEASQGRDEFVKFWTDEEQWSEYMETIYMLEELSE